MNREQRRKTERRIRALRNVTVDRGATPNEARVAQAKADMLARELGPEPTAERLWTEAQTERVTSPGTVTLADLLRRQYKGPVGGKTRAQAQREFAQAFEAHRASIEFDTLTGKAGKGVKVHRYRNPFNWRIEIDR